MEKLNIESYVSNETTENDILIIFVNINMEVISIHRRERKNLKDELEKTKSYIEGLLKIYGKDLYAVVFAKNLFDGIVNLENMNFIESVQ